MEEYFETFKSLDIDEKRKIIIAEMLEVLSTIENICKSKGINYNKLKSSYYISNKNRLFEEDFCDLVFIHVTYLKEDLASLL